MKVCPKCGEAKALEEFHKERSRKDGRRPYCKACARAYREANRERQRERYRAYREANRDRELARERAYREANRERIREGYRAWRKANRERERERLREWYHANYTPSPDWEVLKAETHCVYGFPICEEISGMDPDSVFAAMGYVGIAAERNYDQRHRNHRSEQRAWLAVGRGHATPTQERLATGKPFGWLGTFTEPEPVLLALCEDRESAEWTEQWAIQAFSTPFNRNHNPTFDIWADFLALTGRR